MNLEQKFESRPNSATQTKTKNPRSHFCCNFGYRSNLPNSLCFPSVFLLTKFSVFRVYYYCDFFGFKKIHLYNHTFITAQKKVTFADRRKNRQNWTKNLSLNGKIVHVYRSWVLNVRWLNRHYQPNKEVNQATVVGEMPLFISNNRFHIWLNTSYF